MKEFALFQGLDVGLWERSRKALRPSSLSLNQVEATSRAQEGAASTRLLSNRNANTPLQALSGRKLRGELSHSKSKRDHHLQMATTETLKPSTVLLQAAAARNFSPSSGIRAHQQSTKSSESISILKNFSQLKQGLHHPENTKGHPIHQNTFFLGLASKPSHAIGPNKENIGSVKVLHNRAQSSCLSEFMDFQGYPPHEPQQSNSKGVRVRDLFPK